MSPPATAPRIGWRQSVVGATARALPVGSGTFARAFGPFAGAPGVRPVQVHCGFAMRLDLSKQFHQLFTFGLYDRGLTAELLRWLEPGALFIDVGANIGYYSLLAATRVGASGRVISFEADPANVDALRDNVTLNPGARVEVVAAAAGAHDGRARFVTGEHSVGSTLENAEGTIQTMGPEWVGAEKHVIDVEIATLDTRCAAIARDWPGRRLMKVDIEGAEPLALEGARELLNHLDAAIIECNPPALAIHGYQPADITRVFAALGFEGAAIPHVRGEKIPLPTEWTDWYNLLFTRKRA